MHRTFHGDLPMKKTQLTDALRNIRFRLISYLSVVLIIAMGTGGFFMARYTGYRMTRCAARYYADHQFKDLELAGSIGISEEDLRMIRDTEGVKDAEGVIVLDGTFLDHDTPNRITILSLTDRISVPETVEGTMPEKGNECAVSADFAERFGLKIGDEATISTDRILNADPLNHSTFRITGFVIHPDYVRSKTTWVCVLPRSSFNLEGMQMRYTRAFVTAEGINQLKMFEDSYFSAIAPLRRELRNNLDNMKAQSLARAKQEAYAKIDAEYEKGMEQADEARKQIEDGERQLEEKLAWANAQLAYARAQLNSARSQLLSAEEKLQDAEAMLGAVRELEAAIGAIDPIAMAEFIHTANALIDAWEYAETPEEKAAALQALQDYVNSPEQRIHVEAIRVLTGIDLREATKHPENLPAVREALRDVNAVMMLTSAASAGIGPLDMLAAVDQIDALLVQVDQAETEEERQAARQKLAEYLADPVIAERMRYISYYFGIDSEALLYETFDRSQYDSTARNRLHAMIERIHSIRSSIHTAELMVALGRDQLRAGWAAYYDGLRQVNEKERELHAMEADARRQIAEAKQTLEEKLAEAEEQVAAARKQVEELTCSWVIQERVVNESYLSISSSYSTMKSAGAALGGLLLLVAALVCFSTLVIIIEDERKLVGTAKAFGFRNSEILSKYMVFSVSASVFGSLLGILIASLIAVSVCSLVNRSKLYMFTIQGATVDLAVTIPVIIFCVLMCAAVTAVSCIDLLRTNAYHLLNDGASAGRSAARTGSSHGTLYSRLILRNMWNEKVRVFISMVIIGGSCIVIGTGISTKLGFDGMISRQLNDVYRYDYRISYDQLSAEEQSAFESMMKNHGISSVPIHYSPSLFDKNGQLNGIYILCADASQIGDFLNIRDPKTQRIIPIPDSGILVQQRMKETSGISPGDTMILLDKSLQEHTAEVSGLFQNYAGRFVICTPDGYRKIFGTNAVPNGYYVNLNGMDEEQFLSEMKAITPSLIPEKASGFTENFSNTFRLYNVIVAIAIGIAIIMSFIILTNLASIFITRKKKELIVMRINGFTIPETLRYLARETVFTAVLGMVIGLLLGIWFTPYLLRIMEPPDGQFVRSTHWAAWGIAVLLESIFAFVINASVFRRVYSLNFHDIL